MTERCLSGQRIAIAKLLIHPLDKMLFADNNFLAQPVFGEPGPICEFISFVARDSKNGSKLSWAEGDRNFV